MSKKISELVAVDSVTGKEIIPVLINTDNRTLTVDNIKDYNKYVKHYINIQLT